MKVTVFMTKMRGFLGGMGRLSLGGFENVNVWKVLCKSLQSHCGAVGSIEASATRNFVLQNIHFRTIKVSGVVEQKLSDPLPH